MKKYLTVAILSIFFTLQAINGKQRIKMYLFNSPSHDVMRDEWFLPSLQDDYEIILEKYSQECSNNYKKDGWTKFTQHKIDLILRAIKENWGDFFIYSDVDIQFFAPTQEIIQNLIEDYDMVIQKNSPAGDVCSGFFVCRANKKTKALWQALKRLMQSDAKINDQLALNMLIRDTNPHKISWDYLPDTFYCAGIFTKALWKTGNDLELPEGIVLHHANWTKGTENKIAQLTYVKNKITKRKMHR